MPDGKTIRQIADEIGVTRQAVYQKIKSNKHTVNSLQLYTFTVDSTKYYTPEGEKLVKSLFSDKQAVNKGVNLSTHSVYTLVNEFTPCKHEEKPLKSALSGNNAVNEGVNLSTNSVYTPVNDFTPCKHEEKPLKSTLSGDKAVNEGVNLSTNSVYTPVNEFTVNLTDLFTAQLTEKDHQIAEKDKQLSEKDKQIAEKDKQLAEKDTQIAQLTSMLQNAQEQQAALVQTLAAEQALHAGSIQKRLSETATTTENVVEKKDEEKSTQNFFSRFFKKNK